MSGHPAPIAFLAHINDCAITEEHRWKYVDDLSIGIVSPAKEISTLFEKAQTVAYTLETWSDANLMKINGKKCQILICNFSHSANLDSNVSINDVPVPVVSSMYETPRRLLNIGHEMDYTYKPSRNLHPASSSCSQSFASSMQT